MVLGTLWARNNTCRMDGWGPGRSLQDGSPHSLWWRQPSVSPKPPSHSPWHTARLHFPSALQLGVATRLRSCQRDVSQRMCARALGGPQVAPLSLSFLQPGSGDDQVPGDGGAQDGEAGSLHHFVEESYPQPGPPTGTIYVRKTNLNCV